MKLGIFGGTFNPIHYGHLINGEVIRSDFGLDRILLVPSRHPVHKELDGWVSAEDRYHMTRLAVKGAPEYDVSRIEIDRIEPSYTITTVRALRSIYPDSELFLIIGEDSLVEMDAWREPEGLRDLTRIIVMRRPGGVAFESNRTVGSMPLWADNPLIDISSTMIRERIRAGKSVRFFLPGLVTDYIMEKGLYAD